jgi:putative DNA primase/helicase
MRSDRAEWTLINDVLRRKHKKQDFLAAVKKHDAAQKKQEASDGWRAKLQYKEAKDGSQILEKCVTNLALILEFDPAWRGVLRMNTFSKKITVDAKRCPFNRQDLQWSDADTIAVKVWLETHYPLRPTTNDVHEAILHVCTNARFNPLTDYLDSLDPAPEKEILDMWLIDFFGADDTPYTRAVGARWMIGAVARAMSPGCKVDAVLILEGKQGLKKSSVLEKLCPDPTWFTDGLSDFGSKDQKEEIEGKWIVELGELKGFGKELEQIKAFVTRKSENYRPAYARHEINSPRTCVFAGTVNPSGDGFLRDVTGNRRFWPVSCVKQAPELTPHLRDQLWAEAKARYLAGEKWWIEEEETELLRSAAEQQNSRVEVDVWHEQVSVFVAGNDKVSANDVLEMLKVSTEKRGQREAQRVGRIMKMLGWEKYRDSGDGRPWRYRPTEEAEHRRQRTLF